MSHRRLRQIKKAYMTMKNPMVLFGIDIELPDGTFEFVKAEDLAEWQEKYGDRLKQSGKKNMETG